MDNEGTPTGRRGRYQIIAAVVVWLVVGAMVTGCGSPMPPLPDHDGVGQSVVSVAVLAPQSGELATFGEAMRNGVGLALDEWNARGGVGGQRLRAVWTDTPCEATAAQAVARQVIAEGTRFIVGGMCSEAAVPIARVADESGVLFVASGATHPSVTVGPDGTTRRYVFATAFPYPYQGRAAARFVVESLGITRTAVFAAAADPFARDILATYGPALTAAGGRVVSTTIIDGPDADLVPVVVAAVTNGAGALYVPANAVTVARVSRTVTLANLKVPIIGSDWWSQSDIELSVLAGVYLISHFSLDGAAVGILDWAQRYRSAYSMEPDALAALGYDSAYLLATAMDGAADATPAAVAQTLAAMTYGGVTGEWQFDARHDPLKSAVFVQVRQTGMHRVATASLR